VIGGDFNIIRSVEDKNKPCNLPRWSHTFNFIIEISGLKEVKLIGRKYTWANNLPDPTFEKLDRVLVSVEWDLVYPVAVVTGKNRNVSDHVPLMLNNGSPPPHCNSFRYENCWVERDGFHEIVCNSWNSPTFHKFDIDKWQKKTRRLRRHIKGWHINVEGAYRKEKSEILTKLDSLDKKNEENVLSVGEKET
jgi:hypothetical protein